MRIKLSKKDNSGLLDGYQDWYQDYYQDKDIENQNKILELKDNKKVDIDIQKHFDTSTSTSTSTSKISSFNTFFDYNRPYLNVVRNRIKQYKNSGNDYIIKIINPKKTIKFILFILIVFIIVTIHYL